MNRRLSLSAHVAQALKALLTEKEPWPATRPFRLVTVPGGGPQPGIDLDQTSALCIADDEAGYGGRGPRSR